MWNWSGTMVGGRAWPGSGRKDEAVFFRLLDHLARVLGHLPFAAITER